MVGADQKKRDVTSYPRERNVGEVTRRTFFFTHSLGLNKILNFCKIETMKEKQQQDNGNGKVKILIVDDHSIVRRGLTQLINQEPDFVVCGQAENAMEALVAIKERSFDLAVVDISLDDINGIQLTEKIHLLCPNLPVLILTMHNEAVYAERALRAGASGYVTKNEAAEKIVTAIRQLLCGKEYFSDTVIRNSSTELRTEGWWY